jgi:CheY-like chemotaxis protein
VNHYPSTSPDSPTLLLVDDEASALEAWALLLSLHEFSVHTASDGNRALQLAKATCPHLIITDLMMPIMDGLALCRALRADPDLANIPIILWTAATRPLKEKGALGLLFERCLTKPVAFETLVEHARTLIGPLAPRI